VTKERVESVPSSEPGPLAAHRSDAGPIRALGLMSGTSMDGVDAAVVETDGVTIAAFGRSGFRPYAPAERAAIEAALGRWPGEAGVEAAEAAVQASHATLAAGFPEAALLGFHGQTLVHEPQGRGTHQVGRGDLLADATGRPVVWALRAADVASGGEGAPLVPVFHHAVARHIGAEAPLAFLNIGGVANVTWVDARIADPAAPGALLAFDTGPGNALLDDFLKERLGEAFDEGGRVAARGTADRDVLAEALASPYLDRPPPKSLDRMAFHGVLGRLGGLSTEDGAATLAALTAACVAAAARHFPEPAARWLVCGGGRLNRTVTRLIAAGTNAPVDAVESVGLDGDMLEAQAFAFLAVRVLRGLPTSFPATTGCRLPVCGGRVSAPRRSGPGAP
jgi:anhydro-N-acetylmuramic acid kinase